MQRPARLSHPTEIGPTAKGATLRSLFAGAVLLLLQVVFAGSVHANEPDETQAFFGELHVHTSLSTDAYMNGTRKHPMTAYRFAQGDPITLSTGEVWQLSRPLDFVAMTDHAESFGDLRLCTTPGSPVYDQPLCQGMRGTEPVVMGRVIGGWSVDGAQRNPETCGADGQLCIEAAKTTWQITQDAANRANRPGEFTALVGYEYSPVILDAAATSKIHRNVIFRTEHVPDRVFSSYDGTAEDMHEWLEKECEAPCQVLTIPHNTNASSSRIFGDGKNSDGTPWTQAILDRRAKFEPLVEIYQGKGNSECHLGLALGQADEECGFEQWVRNCEPGETQGCSTRYDMVRDTLVRGLSIEEEWGVNPFKLGFIGSTDSHLGTPGATEENNYHGQLGRADESPEKRLVGGFPSPDGSVPSDGGWGFMGPTKFSPGGLAVVWAPENTRSAIWDALARKETYSTSGSRIQLRFFGGFDYPRRAHGLRNAIEVGYDKGVPMGGDLKGRPDGKAPRFILWAARDPESAPLQKLQVVKGWTENGENQVRVFDVACADGAKPDKTTRRCPASGAEVNLKTCEIDHDKGDAELSTTWSDPEFDAERRAVYYVRAIENPVCRWSTHDALRIGAALPTHVPPSIKERAWSSPIWYTP